MRKSNLAKMQCINMFSKSQAFFSKNTKYCQYKQHEKHVL